MIDVNHKLVLELKVIIGFRCRKTARLFNGEHVSGLKRQAEKRLRLLDAANTLEALQALPSNHFESLSGDRKGQHSIRVNMQWRICFIWHEGAHDVEIVDYH